MDIEQCSCLLRRCRYKRLRNLELAGLLLGKRELDPPSFGTLYLKADLEAWKLASEIWNRLRKALAPEVCLSGDWPAAHSCPAVRQVDQPCPSRLAGQLEALDLCSWDWAPELLPRLSSQFVPFRVPRDPLAGLCLLFHSLGDFEPLKKQSLGRCIPQSLRCLSELVFGWAHFRNPPNPLDFPESRSNTSLAETTGPTALNA